MTHRHRFLIGIVAVIAIVLLYSAAVDFAARITPTLPLRSSP